MTIHNRFIGKFIKYLLRDKIRKFQFAYELELYETDVVDQTYVRKWIIELQTAVDEEIERLTEEYHL